MEDKNFIKGLIYGILLMAVLGFGGYTIYQHGLSLGKTTQQTAPDSRKANHKIQVIEDLMDDLYLEDIDDDKLTESMYAGMVKGLGDRYSRYYTSEEYESMAEETEGVYQGIGVVMQQDPETRLITVIRCYEGSPGAEAGILPGDVLYKIDDQEVTDMELTEVAKLIRNKDTKVAHITIAREGNNDYIQVEVEKDKVEMPSVSYEMLDDKVGYLAVYEFTAVTANQYEAAFDDLVNQGMERLVIDLRGNPGGLVTSVCEILNTILPKGLIVYTEDKYGERQEYTSEGKTPIQIPLAVLVNENSASAAEIFAGAVQDYGIGTLVGTTTFGKGIVQKITELTDGSAVKLTISKYYTPKGRNIHGTGITPDVEVELEDTLKQKIVIEKEEDNQLQKALEFLG